MEESTSTRKSIPKGKAEAGKPKGKAEAGQSKGKAISGQPKGKAEAARTKGKGRAKSTQPKKEKINSKMVAIALIFVMLFVSYVVIFTSQDTPSSSKNMVFYQDEYVLGTRYGNVTDINVNLIDVRLTIHDSSSDSTNTTNVFEDGTILETLGNFNCTYFDWNNNGMLDEADEFRVHHASPGDQVNVYRKSTGEKVAYYTF